MAETMMGQERSPLEALMRNFGRLGRQGTGSLLVPWLAIAAVDFGFVAISMVIVWVTGPAVTGAGWGVQLIGIIQALAVMTLRVSLLKTLRDLAFQGPSGVGSLGAIVRSMIERIGPAFVVTLAVGVVVSIGMILCVLPGLVALFFLAFAPYLVVARGASVGDAFAESARWAQKEWVLLLTAIVVAVLATGIMACTMGLFSGIDAQRGIAVPAGLFSGWIINTVLGYLAFLWWGSVYVTAESRRQVDTLRQTSPETAGDESGFRDGPMTYRTPPSEGGEW